MANAADYMELACNEWSLGYSQENRTHVYDGGETDCSALVSWCNFMAENISHNPWFSTRTEYDFLTSQGFTVLDPEYDVPERGDTLLTTGHTAIYLGGGLIGEAVHDEYGDIAGGEPGDQTGDETRVSYYYPSNWDCILRPPEGDEQDDNHDDDKEVFDMTDWAIVAFDGCGYLYAGGKLHALANQEEQQFVEYVYGEAKRQIDGGSMPHIVLGDGVECTYGVGPWGKKLAEILAR